MMDDYANHTSPTAATSTATTGTANDNRRSFARQVSSVDAPLVKTGIFGASSNLINAIVGAGIIGIPYSIKQSGLVVGVILLVVVGILTDKSLRMIVNLATYHPKLCTMGVLTYEDLMSIPFGTMGRNFVLINMFILAYGAMVAYLLIIKDSLPTVLGLGSTFMERELVMFITSLVVIVPLSMMRDISQLSFTSVLSVTADALLVLIVLFYAPYPTTIANAGGIGTILQENWINANLFIGLGVISTAMACQHAAFLISGTLDNHTPSRWGSVTAGSLAIATGMSLCLGIFGYLGYLNDTQGDILLNFDAGSTAVNAARTLLAITMFLTYPMEAFVARHVLVQLLYNGNLDNTSIGSTGEQISESKLFGFLGRKEQVTLGIYTLTLIPALILRDLGPVLSITGSIGASCLAYIAPGLVYLGLFGSDFCIWCGLTDYPRTIQSEVELPVAGDATATMTTTTTTLATERQSTKSTPYDSSAEVVNAPQKGIWWWIRGMPVWIYIATIGDRNTHQFMIDFGRSSTTTISPNQQQLSTSIGPCRYDFLFSIFFIVFGVVAAVAGLASNIYVQVNDVFFSPH